MPRKLSVLIVPDEGGPPRRLHVPTFWLKVAGWLLVVIIIGVAAAVVNYSRVIQRALDWDRLAAENERLREENRRIVRVAREVDQGRQILARIVRGMGGHIDMSQPLTPAGAETDDASAGSPDRAVNLSAEAASLLKTSAIETSRSASEPDHRPVAGFISKKFVEDPLFPDRSHRGIDIAGKLGAPVVASGDGRVIFSGWTTYFGNTLMVAHPGGWVTFYGHNEQNLKEAQAEVKRGEPIALLGSTGKSSAPHLHYEIWKDGVPVDPERLFKGE
ncbi:MAG: hypothetical protein FJY67_05160 [Calditrichaeota bacterium]|nr:hypothetical protein [Calditrichota bacterium]